MRTVFVKPRGGVVLAGIPAAGAEVPEALAREWIEARLVTSPSAANASPRAGSRERKAPVKPAAEG